MMEDKKNDDLNIQCDLKGRSDVLNPSAGEWLSVGGS